MTVEIKDFRLSFIWTATLLRPDQPPIASFGRRNGYVTLFNGLSASSTQAFVAPWPREHPYAHKFWAYYLGEADPSGVQGEHAWKMGVPLRLAQPRLTITAPWFEGRIVAEHFLHPFGVAFVVTFSARSTLVDNKWVDLSISIGRDPFDVLLAGGATQAMTLVGAASQIMSALREEFFGPDAQALPPPDPFSIATVINGSGVDPALQPDEAIHRMIYGVATRRANYTLADLDPLLKTTLDSRNGAAPGDLVFATKRGRVIWFPSAFTKTGSERTVSLSCYHRNQVLAALQADSLCGLATELAERIQKNPTLPATINPLGEIAAEILPRMHDGDPKTYRSGSLRQQIADHNIEKALAVLRPRYGLAEWP